ncbi:hypothetical protein FOA52_013898 [Chlamydomonas sp. UWO 241]|nr:hypothetical protein FOA52_013898 [Chlamydomonas sp. UWO 241]
MGLTPGAEEPGVQVPDLLLEVVAAGPSGSSDKKDTAELQYAETQLLSIATHILDLHPAGQGHLGSGSTIWQGVAGALREKSLQGKSLDATAGASGSSNDAGEPSTSTQGRPGRLGPERVTIDKASARGSLQYSQKDLAAEGLNNFSSFRANVCVYSGKWMYEALIQPAWQPGIQQVGWATIHCPFTAEEGVGDAPDSYAYDGKRVRKWNVKSAAYGEAWAAGDVIGACLDLDKGEISFHRNGAPMGVAFHNVRTMQPHLAYFPTVSLSYTERCELNFGLRPFVHPVPGFAPLHAAPPDAALDFSDYLLGCLERLAKTAANSRAGPGSWGAEEGPWGGAGDAAGPAGGGLASPAEASTSQVAASGGDAQAAAQPQQQRFGCTRQLSPDDAALFAGAIGAHLVPCLLPPNGNGGGGGCVAEHLCAGALLNTLLSLHGDGEPHDGAAARAAVRLLQVTISKPAFSALMLSLLDALARRCVSAPMVPSDFPYSASYPYLALAVCLLAGVPEVRAALLAHPGLYVMLEAFMARKPPSAEDLKGLLPTVWWPGCKEDAASEGRMRDGLRAFAAAKARVEDCQYVLLTLLVGQPAGGGGSGSSGAVGVEDDALVAFVRYLVQKNRGATRDVQPAGLSDPNVLLSVWFVLMRLLNGVLPGVGQFPADDMFVRASQRGSIDPTNDLPRLGGLLSYLLRESPVGAADLKPLDIELPPPLNPQPLDAAGAALARTPGVACELLHLSAMLYTYRGAGVVRQIHTMNANLASNLSGLEQVEKQLEARLLGGSAAAGGSSPGSRGAAGAAGRHAPAASVSTAAAPSTSVVSSAVGAAPAAGAPVAEVAAAGAAAAAAAVAAATAPAPASPAAAGSPPPAAAPAPAPSASVSRPASVAYLHEARTALRGEVQTAVRCIRLLESTFFGGWKMEALLRQACWLSAALTKVAQQTGPLLAFVPTCYLELLLDMLSAYRGVEAPFAPPAALRAHGLDELLAFVGRVLNDERIRSPDTKEQLLAAATGALESPDMSAVVEANGPVASALVSSAVAMFDSKLWHPVSSLLAQVTRGSGLGARCVGRPQLVACQALLTEALQPGSSLFKGFCDRLFNTLNWAVTEGTSTVATLHEARRPAAAQPSGRRPAQVDEQQLTRKAVLMLDLTKSLLRLLEFMAQQLPSGFLGRASSLNLTRTLELVPFVLGHFAGGADARRLNELLEASRANAGPQAMLRVGVDRTSYTVIHVDKPLFEKVNKAEILVPLVGTLLALWRAGQACSVSDDGGGDDDDDAGPPLPPVSFIDAMADVADARVQTQLKWLSTGLDWEASLPGADGLAEGLREYRALVDEVIELRGGPAADAATAGDDASTPGKGGDGAPGSLSTSPSTGGGLGSLAVSVGGEMPEEFLDPITTAVMTDPVLLPDSGITVDRSTAERHLATSTTDPFSRTELTLEMVRPNIELRAKIRAYMAQRAGSPKRQGGGGVARGW